MAPRVPPDDVVTKVPCYLEGSLEDLDLSSVKDPCIQLGFSDPQFCDLGNRMDNSDDFKRGSVLGLLFLLLFLKFFLLVSILTFAHGD